MRGRLGNLGDGHTCEPTRLHHPGCTAAIASIESVPEIARALAQRRNHVPVPLRRQS
jgi:hypothetical protein